MSERKVKLVLELDSGPVELALDVEGGVIGISAKQPLSLLLEEVETFSMALLQMRAFRQRQWSALSRQRIARRLDAQS